MFAFERGARMAAEAAALSLLLWVNTSADGVGSTVGKGNECVIWRHPSTSSPRSCPVTMDGKAPDACLT